MSKETKKHLVVLLLYIVVIGVMSWPLLPNVTTHVVGSGGDPWQTMWRFGDRLEAFTDTFRDASEVSTGQFLQAEFFGGGEARLVNNSVWPWMLIHGLFGQPLGYNIVWLMSFVLSGYFMFLLARYLLVRGGVDSSETVDVAAFLSGLLYMLAPYHVAHSFGHFGAMQVQWLPLIILLGLMWWKRPTTLKTLGLALVVTIQSWTEHHYTFWFVLFLFFGAIFHWQQLQRWWREAQSSKLKVQSFLLVALILVLAILPWWPTVRLAFDGSQSLSLGVEQTIRFSADPFSFVIPAAFHSVWGVATHTLFSQHFTGNVFEATHFLGLFPLLLVIFFHRSIPRRQKLFWVGTALLFLVLSLGPRLHLLGAILPIPLPWAVLDSLPVFSAVRAVGRASVFVVLALSVLFAWVAATNLRRRSWQLLAGCLLVIEFLFMPVPLQSTGLSSVYDAVRDLPGERIVELPAATNYTAASKALYASNEHSKPVVGSIALERGQDGMVLEEVRSLPGLRQLLYLRTTHLQERRPDFFAQDLRETTFDTLRALDIGGVLIHRDSLSAQQVAVVTDYLERYLGLAPEQFEDAVLYPVSTEELVSGDGAYLTRDDRWSYVFEDEEWRMPVAAVEQEATVSVFNANDESVEVSLSFIPLRGVFHIAVNGEVHEVSSVTNAAREAVTFSLSPHAEAEVVFSAAVPGAFTLGSPVLQVR